MNAPCKFTIFFHNTKARDASRNCLLLAHLLQHSIMSCWCLQAVAELCLDHQQPGAAWQALAAWHAAATAAGNSAHLPTILQLLLAAHPQLAAGTDTAAAAERLSVLATVLQACMPIWTQERVEQQVGCTELSLTRYWRCCNAS